MGRIRSDFVSRFFRRKLNHSLNSVRRKGHERLTIMFIPHGKEQVFSLQLNWSMILFLFGSLTLAIILSLYGVYRQLEKSSEISRLKTRYGQNLDVAVQVQESIVANIELKIDLLKQMQSMARLSGASRSMLAQLPDEEQARSTAKQILQNEVLERLDMGPSTDYLPPVYSLRTLATMLHQQTPLVNLLKRSLQDRMGIYGGMPIGRPLHKGFPYTDTSHFGTRSNPKNHTLREFHAGMDMATQYGAPVFATASGIVHEVVYSHTGYGNSIILAHSNGFYSLYAHLSAIYVARGVKISRGQKIGAVGTSGRTTGSHLHYEVRMENDVKTNPAPYVCAFEFNSRICRAVNRRYDL